MKSIITILRVAIGWHFLYEGLIKLFAGNWSAESYLTNTYGSFSGFYHWLAASPESLAIVNFLNIWGLTLIGLSLFLGLFIRWSSLFGAFLLLLYYFAYPPYGISMLGGDGSTFIINQQIIEAAALIFLIFYKEKGYAIDNLLPFLMKRKTLSAAPVETSSAASTGTTDEQPNNAQLNRRDVLKNLVSLPVLGLFGWGAWKTGRTADLDATTGTTIRVKRVALSEVKGVLPKGKILHQELTRLVAGGNLISGFAHARDLIYNDTLFKAYNTERKIFETLMLCEQAGINGISIGYENITPILKYKKLTGNNFKLISQTSLNFDKEKGDKFVYVKTAIDSGADIIQVHGGQCDRLVKNGQIDQIGEMIAYVRSQGIVAGLGAHTIDALLACEEQGIIPDYYMHTMHHDNYWSAHPREHREKFEILSGYSKDHNKYHDNLFCPFPERSIEFLNRIKTPVMGYKVLAAGAIKPEDGFNWAFENGADFICVGMFDFQVVTDVNICLDVLKNLKNRTRPWCA